MFAARKANIDYIGLILSNLSFLSFRDTAFLSPYFPIERIRGFTRMRYTNLLTYFPFYRFQNDSNIFV